LEVESARLVGFEMIYSLVKFSRISQLRFRLSRRRLLQLRPFSRRRRSNPK
jgi:hypothetical protein